MITLRIRATVQVSFTESQSLEIQIGLVACPYRRQFCQSKGDGNLHEKQTEEC
jgi:hypothetical protein